ncbi:hypothetical protein [Kineosporia sp. NBRC 101731]|uniref:hypothetical protein n=1 Tax=Kineosporia sp. NBRC 101731 TaxID=3032199 RepID=UPI0024A1610A|nr:hypothetical protein [Kineosporia sp. NBRC 101731]GLY32512.1 hypothetical protein Kisp02_58770 [Kineosporia sp. NBRC 101731]
MINVASLSFISLFPLFTAVDRIESRSLWAIARPTWVFLTLLTFAVGTALLLFLPRQDFRTPPAGHNDIGESGQMFTYSWISHYFPPASIGMPAVLGLGFAYELSSWGPVGVILSVLCAAGSLYLTSLFILVVRRGRAKLVLTPSGIYNHAAFIDQFVPWSEVAEIRTVNGQNPHFEVHFRPGPHVRTTTVGRPWIGKDERSQLVFQALALGSHAVPAYEAVCTYFNAADVTSQRSAG